MPKSKETKILIPEGCFEGNCYSCVYGKPKKMYSDGRVPCTGPCGGYNFPHDKENCTYYEWKVKSWLKCGVVLYFIIAFLVTIIEALLK